MLASPTIAARGRAGALALATALGLSALGASPALGATTTVALNGGFEAGAAGWVETSSCSPLCVTTNGRLVAGNPADSVEAGFSAALGLGVSATGTSTWSSPSFVHAGSAAIAAKFRVDRRASVGAIVAVGGPRPGAPTSWTRRTRP